MRPPRRRIGHFELNITVYIQLAADERSQPSVMKANAAGPYLRSMLAFLKHKLIMSDIRIAVFELRMCGEAATLRRNLFSLSVKTEAK